MPREDQIIKKQREQLSTLRGKVLILSKELNSLDSQYKRVIDELRRQVKDLINNAPKAFFLYINLKVKKLFGK